MTVESSFNYPSDLNASLPATNDARSEGDDHIRGIKSVLKTTLPNVNAAINASDEELNYVVGVTSAIQTQLNATLSWTGAKGGSTTLSAKRLQVYVCNSTSSTVNLPASPTDADVVIFVSIAVGGTTVGRNGRTINGAASNVTAQKDAINFFIAVDSDWIYKNIGGL